MTKLLNKEYVCDVCGKKMLPIPEGDYFFEMTERIEDTNMYRTMHACSRECERELS